MMAAGVLTLHWHPLLSLRPGAFQSLPDVSIVWLSHRSVHEVDENVKVLQSQVLSRYCQEIVQDICILLRKAKGESCVCSTSLSYPLTHKIPGGCMLQDSEG